MSVVCGMFTAGIVIREGRGIGVQFLTFGSLDGRRLTEGRGSGAGRTEWTPRPRTPTVCPARPSGPSVCETLPT